MTRTVAHINLRMVFLQRQGIDMVTLKIICFLEQYLFRLNVRCRNFQQIKQIATVNKLLDNFVL